MPIAKKFHLYMAAIMFASGVLVCLFGLGYKADLCSRLSTNEPPQVVSYFKMQSDSTAVARPTVLIASLMLMVAALIPWQRFTSYNDIESYWKNHSDNVGNQMRSFDAYLVWREMWNFIIYLALSIIFCALLVLIASKPEALFWVDTPSIKDIDGVPIRCYPGFGAFIWFDVLILVIFIGCFLITILSMFNLQKRYQRFYQNIDISMTELEDCFISTPSLTGSEENQAICQEK